MSNNATVPTILDSRGLPIIQRQAAAPEIRNGLGEAIGFFSPFGFPQNQGVPGSAQVENVNTSFRNLRWYLVSNFRQFLNQLYAEIGLVSTIVDVPVDDALRGGIEITSKQLSEDQVQELLISLDRDDDLNTVGQGAKWNRLFGGAGILILTDQDPSEPLEIEDIGPDEPLEFRALDMWELTYDMQNIDGYNPSTQQETFDYYSYYGVKVHKSRVMRLKGIEAPSFIRPRLRGWGISVVETLIRSMNQYLKATDLIFEVTDEFKVDVYKIKNLVNDLMSPAGEEGVRRRVQMGNWQKNYQNALVMDSEDDWDHKQLSFSGLGEMMQQNRIQVASDMRMPMLKLFGTPASGLNADDEDSLEVYNSMVEGQVRNKIKYPILRILEIKSQKLFGFVPDDLAVKFKPLRVMSSEQEETIKTQKFTRLIQAREIGEITSDQFRDACNKENLLGISLDKDDVGGYEDDTVAEGDNDPDKSKDTDDEGADRSDSQKPKAKDRGGIPKGGKEPGKEPAPAKGGVKPQDGASSGRRRPGVGEERESGNFGATEDESESFPKKGKSNFPRKLNNSAAFDRASYEADGGDSWIDPRRREFFENPRNIDTGLWSKAKDGSQKAGGGWQMTAWLYRKLGGRFS